MTSITIRNTNRAISLSCLRTPLGLFFTLFLILPSLTAGQDTSSPEGVRAPLPILDHTEEKTDESDEDAVRLPNPLVDKTEEKTDESDEDALRTGLCPPGAGGETLFCASEIQVGGTLPAAISGAMPRIAVFFLDRHETVSLETFGELSTRGELYDARGHRLAVARSGGGGENFRLTRTLPPGRYYVLLDAHGDVPSQAKGSAAGLRLARHKPVRRAVLGAPVDGDDHANHCGLVASLPLPGHAAGTFERPADVDVLALDIPHDGEWRIEVSGAAHYELKAADCMASVGVGGRGFGAALASLKTGRYFLYVSSDAVGTGFEVSVEAR